MKTWLKSGLVTIFIFSCVAPAAQAKFDYESINQLPPGERYRQLSLLLLISGGTNAELLEMIKPLSESDGENAGAGDVSLRLEDYGTPLARIVDQETMLASLVAVISAPFSAASSSIAICVTAGSATFCASLSSRSR